MLEKLESTAFVDQFDRAVLMFKEAISGFPVHEWFVGASDYVRPAGVAYHVIESIEFYTGSLAVDQFHWGGRFGCDWEDPDSTKLPTHEQVLDYLGDIWIPVRLWMLEVDLSQSEDLFPWTGTLLQGRLLYLLRHIQHHTAEMCLELKRRGYAYPEWR